MPGAYDHVVTFVELCEEPGDIIWVVLTVGIEKEKDIPTRLASTGFYRSAIAHAVGMTHKPDVVLLADLCCSVSGAIIYDDDLRLWIPLPDSRKQLA
jgi:hypothetical protein